MIRTRDAFCSFCGTAHAPPLAYPRTCPNAACAVTVWANPIPVAVALVPVVQEGRTGLLVVRRGIEPQRGKLALVGGFLEEHETWQQGAAREVREETGVTIDEGSLEPFWYVSTEPRPNRVLLFCVASPVDARSFPKFSPNAETEARAVVFGDEGLEDVFAFPLHVRAARRWLRAAGLSGRLEVATI